MEVKYRQNQIGWCSCYLLANIFNSSFYLKYAEIPEYKGCSDKEINEMLDGDKSGLRIDDVLLASQNYLPLPKDYIFDVITKHEELPADLNMKIPMIVFLLSVHRIMDCWHHVAVIKINDGLWYLDPWNKEYVKIDGLESFKSLFIDCCLVQRFVLKENNHWALLRGEYLGFEPLLSDVLNPETSVATEVK